MFRNNRLWDETPAPSGRFDPASIGHLPDPVRTYLEHAIEPGTPLYSAARISMEGEIKLKGWAPFKAIQTMRIGQGFDWRAKVRMGLAMISGADSFLDGSGSMTWKLFGLFSVVSASGPDIDRSSRGRMVSESVVFPLVFLQPGVAWTSESGACSAAMGPGDDQKLDLTLGPSGALQSVSMLRWGNPEGGAFGLARFGGVAEEERTFGRITIPSQLRIGWHFGTGRFAEGEFFRCRITAAEFR